ncbi:hypothetical protein ASE70_08060 [Sphingomonas sp. Leaf22]|nr:hypothetical protein ASE70_08060 [Sphingomonas sp. Leaf22]
MAWDAGSAAREEKVQIVGETLKLIEKRAAVRHRYLPKTTTPVSQGGKADGRRTQVSLRRI